MRWQANECTEDDIEVLRTINHEAYHFGQTVASGYMYDRQTRIFAALNREDALPHDAEEEEELEALMTLLKKDAGDDPALIQRADNVIHMLREHSRFGSWEERAAANDHSWAGAMFPHLFKFQEEISAQEAIPNDEGLSIVGVLEGSAVVHTQLLMGGDEGASGRIEAELETLPPQYSELYALTKQHCGDRATELLLPATSFALQYTRPHDAYLPLLKLFIGSSSGSGFEFGCELRDSLPEIQTAGPILGTAIEVYRQSENPFEIYASFLQGLDEGSWKVDSYILLAHPGAMHLIPSFPFGLLTRDGYRGAMDRAELAARMLIMSVVLRVRGRRRQERDFRKWQLAWAQQVIGRLGSELASDG